MAVPAPPDDSLDTLHPTGLDQILTLVTTVDDAVPPETGDARPDGPAQ